MQRIYSEVVRRHFAEHRQMLFLMGPRQVGKTTTCLMTEEEWSRASYFNWDNEDDRALLVEGPRAIAERVGLDRVGEEVPIIVFDEIHKYSRWKGLLKGLYDSYPNRAHILVTGSARLDVFKSGGDSLMGRYLSCRFHPLSVAEICRSSVAESEISQPVPVRDAEWEALVKFGGYPDPFLKRNVRFFNQWKRLRAHQLVREDLRDLTRIQELDQLERLAELLALQAGQLTPYSAFAKKLQVTSHTARRWLNTFKSLYYCYEVRPWSKNVTRSLLKEPKFYLWDWSIIQDVGARAESMVASHLLKAVHFWTDHGFGDYGLYYLRDKQKREVDFVVTKDGAPWFLVEVKKPLNKGISPHLHYFKELLQVPHAFQVVVDLPYVEADCFSYHEPVIVPARTFLSQLV